MAACLPGAAVASGGSPSDAEYGYAEDSDLAALEDRCDRLAACILARLERRGIRLAAAESLTGGLLADAFVRIPGASKVFLGSAVTYDIAAKASILGVDRGLLDTEGAVHPLVAGQMADGAARLYHQPRYDAVIGLSTTGVAGPGPDGDKPAGLVYVGFHLPGPLNADGRERTQTRELRLRGSRERIRRQVVERVLMTLCEFTAFLQEDSGINTRTDC
ncbi:CinA family protein [Bifidobacterium jacchi]|uniref:Nicotinamide-nucleotide amidohydrolase family protein n=1 Tax=Bifidobacterium jacchi TaxID=2490545 RepID=A0A5N5RL86_9BIFI|nr:nicotinamide-nucleotide amidohydrolase family protein [Bifidobacterium jacchi]KAB5607729.1 nicotinamide-nucleotide amidohydrolase family protein [Bifidobacterium jacchi]